MGLNDESNGWRGINDSPLCRIAFFTFTFPSQSLLSYGLSSPFPFLFYLFISEIRVTNWTSLQEQEHLVVESLFIGLHAPTLNHASRTQPADVYSFGVLLLELLTGKTPFQDLVQEHGSDIPQWVRSVREEETEFGDEPSSGNETAEGKLQALLNIAMACITHAPGNRPPMREVLKMITDVRAEAQVSSNSSDHSPGQWSDTVQSFPREEHLSIKQSLWHKIFAGIQFKLLSNSFPLKLS
ncbi:hypothetical protein F3Y22_tig00110279pilonHSYRG00002 [Hibiscus syriacus]|uniref:Protein kinase domain-containing protein n=1 Tax=Hibiscus syriacus TaxID=106335 RepID=A0A6A3B8J4_HIBSY|nr:hypothetical protein F3Y22_tig00110279pilonHSYRG00002 [Hibiscus syriacus]